MSTRSSSHAKEERAIFDAFLAAHPSLAAQIKQSRQPDEEFPDVVVELKDGVEVDFELGEWLHGVQMAETKRRERQEAAIRDAIGPQGPNSSRHFRAVMLTLRENPPKFEPADRQGFKAAVTALISDTERRWPSERWHSPQGRMCRELDAFSPLGKYLSSVVFHPLVVRGKARPWPPSQPWIRIKRACSYSPETATQALRSIFEQKIRHYGRFSRPTRLVIYYNKAVAYNDPYIGLETGEFADVAGLAAREVSGQTIFEKIYLLNALEPGLEAFEIYPGCTRCS